MNRIAGLLVVVLLLAGCQQQTPEQTKDPAATPPTPPAPVAPPTPLAPTPTKQPATPARMLYEPLAFTILHADTAFRAAGRRYYLTLGARLDTLQSLTYQTRRDTIHGYQGNYTFTVRDSLRQVVGQRTLHKQNFYAAVGGDLAVLSYANLPTLLGYSEPLGCLVFTVNFGAPETDWLVDAVLLLTLDGQVRQLVTDYVVGGPDVHATLAADGRTLLTIEKIFRSNGAPLPLARPGMELRGATLLGDSLAVAVYEPGSWRPHPGERPDWAVSPTQNSQPNAFIINTHNGRQVGSFRYDGFWEELGVSVPCEYLPATRTGYFLDDKKGLYLVSAALPGYVVFRPLKSLTRFAPPARPSEKLLSLPGYHWRYQFYLDTLDASRIRYQREQGALE